MTADTPTRRRRRPSMLGAGARLGVDLSQATLEVTSAAIGDAELQRISPYDATGHPVLAVPGLMGDERSVRRLNHYLRRRGFAPTPWPRGRNLGPRGESFEEHLDTMVAELKPLLERMSDDASAPVSLVGHSLGGVLSRELGRRLPDEIDRIITLGAPVFGVGEQDNPIIGRIGQRLRGKGTSYTDMMDGHSYGHWDSARPDLPCVSIVSPIDQVIDRSKAAIPQESLDGAAGPIRENVTVRSSHIGMVSNPFVLLTVADRLLADPQEWQCFDPDPYLWPRPKRFVRHIFPPIRY